MPKARTKVDAATAEEALFHVIQPNRKSLGECTKADLIEMAHFYEFAALFDWPVSSGIFDDATPDCRRVFDEWRVAGESYIKQCGATQMRQFTEGEITDAAMLPAAEA